MEDIQEEVESTVPEVWKYAKPQLVASQDPDDPAALEAAAAGPKMGQLIKFLNNIDDVEELEQRVQERDPSTNMTLLQWATLTGRFVLVEWLVKKAKRAAFAFVDEPLHEITVFDKWDEIRKEVAEREKKKAAALKENGGVAPEEEDEDAEPEPTADELAFEALADYHDEWGTRGKGLVKAIGELGVYQGARDEHGAKCGLGMSLYPQGDAYTGEYRDCMRHGKGTYYFASEGMVYTGDWKNNMRHGVGRMVYTDGGRYLGAWEFDKRSGEGRYTYPDGSSYAGEWQADVKHGKGTYSFVDGSRYSGRFYDGVFTSGEWLHGAGQRYVGSFGPDGAPFGKGVFHFPNGTRQSGEYRNGKWIPAQPFILPTLVPAATIELALQNKKVPLSVSQDCSGFGEDVLARIANFAPLHEWASKIEAERGIFVQSITVASATLDATRTPTAVRIKVKAVDASGAVVKGLTEGFTLVAPEQRIVILLRCGGKTHAVVQQSVSLAAGGASTVMFPSVRVTRQGDFASAFVSAAVGALRLEQPTRHNTTAIPPASYAASRYTNALVSACVYIQDVHVDTIATAGARLDAVAASLPPFERPRLMPLDEVAASSIDAMTVLLVHRLAGDFKDITAAGATVEAQRPPTPIPPPMEPRPNIEPLLEAERQRKEDAEA